MSTEAPLGSPSSLIGPVYVDSAARPMLVIARYIAAPPAAVPMSARRSRLRMFVASRSDIIYLWALCPSRVILIATPDRYKRHGTKQRIRSTFESCTPPHKRRPKKQDPHPAVARNPQMKDYCPASGGAMRPSAVVSGCR